MSDIIEKELNTEIDILGTTWLINFRSEEEESDLQNNCGFADDCEKIITVAKRSKPLEELAVSIYGQKINQQRTLRHELIHAYLSECGLGDSSTSTEAWATNEEMVDWFARMSPKIFGTYKDLGLI